MPIDLIILGAVISFGAAAFVYALGKTLQGGHVDRAPVRPPRSPTDLYNGDPSRSNPRTAAILAKAERANRQRQTQSSLHAHEITPADAALLRALGGATFGPNASVTLPSGRTVVSSEIQRWVSRP